MVDVKVKNQKQKNNGVYLGEKSTTPVVLEDYKKTYKNDNMLVIGKAGVGRGFSVKKESDKSMKQI